MSNYIVDTINYKGYDIKIYHDNEPWHPRADQDTLSRIVHWHSKYDLGDRINSIEDIPFDEDDYYLPLYIYDHGGITINTTGFSCSWDSGQIGWVYCTKEDVEAWFSVEKMTKERILEHLRSDIKEYDQYLTGDVYEYFIPQLDENMGGFYGSDHKESGLLENAYDTIDYDISQKKQSHFNNLKAWIKNNVPYIYRNTFKLI